MPASLEQWRAAVGTWNRCLSMQSHYRKDNIGATITGPRLVEWSRAKSCGGLLLIILALFYVGVIGSILAIAGHSCNILGGSTPMQLDSLFVIRWDYISIVAKRLLIISGDIEVNPGPTMNLKMLLNLLHEVRAKWYAIGIQLDISTGTLDAIKASNTDCGVCLREMIMYWLSTKSHNATSDALLEALASDMVGENTLAEKARHLHLTLNPHEGDGVSVAQTDMAVARRDMAIKCMCSDMDLRVIDCEWTGTIFGKGSFGTVLEMKSKRSEQIYAGKKYHDIPRPRQQFLKRLCGHLFILCKINHPNIVRTVGITFDDVNSPTVLMECMRTTFQDYILDQKVFPALPLVQKTKLLCDVANGLRYLHNCRPVILHRDLTATNVLLDSTLTVAKLSDFGNARALNLTYGCTPFTSQSGTEPYMPPEALQVEGSFDGRFDVFSFGHLMLFTIAGEIPALLGATYVDESGGIQGRSELDRRRKHIIKCQKQLGYNHTLNLLMTGCLHNLPQKRPTAEVLVKTLEYVMSHDDSESNIHLLLQLGLQERQFRVTSTTRTNAPQHIDRGAACSSHDGVAYFTPYNSHWVFKYELESNKWTELPLCPQANFGLAVISGLLTAIGGEDRPPEVTEKGPHTNALVSLRGTQWLKKFPPMNTPRSRPAVVSSSDGVCVVAAGGVDDGGDWWSTAVEHYNCTTRQWTSLAPMPIRLPGICAALCGDQLYLLDWTDSAYTCSLQSLLAYSLSSRSSDAATQSLWTAIHPVPSLWSTPVSVGDKLVVVGGHTRPNTTNAVHLYDQGKWTCIGHMSYSRKDSIVTTPRDDIIMVVGGLDPGTTDDVEILTLST